MGKKSIYTLEERILNKRKYNAERRLRKLDEFKAAGLRWRKNHPEYFQTQEYKQKHAKRSREYNKLNREKINERRRIAIPKKKKEDELYKMIINVRAMIHTSFKRTGKYKKKNKTEEILGCTIEFFINYLLSKAPIGTTVTDFHRYGYHMDHITPISSAKTEEEVIKLCHYTNFQPLWWKENLQKSNKII